MIAKTLETKPKGRTHWSTRKMAAESAKPSSGRRRPIRSSALLNALANGPSRFMARIETTIRNQGLGKATHLSPSGTYGAVHPNSSRRLRMALAIRPWPSALACIGSAKYAAAD